jgi:drug/metabolite transporter (DMT)-like permease
MLIASFSFAVMGVLVKLVERRLPVDYAIFSRSFVGLGLSWWILRRAGLSWRGRKPWLLVLRGCLGFSALYCSFHALALLPLSDAVVLQQTHPIWTAFLAALVLKEKADLRVWLGSAIALTGVVCVIRPSFLFQGGTVMSPEHLLGIGLALLAAMISAGSYVTVRALRKSEDPIVVVFWFALIATPAGIPGMVTQPVWPTWLEVAMLIGVGCSVQLGQMLMTRALHRETAGRVAAVGYMQVVFAFLFGAIFFGEPMPAVAVAGALLVIAGALVVTLDRRARSG